MTQKYEISEEDSRLFREAIYKLPSPTSALTDHLQTLTDKILSQLSDYQSQPSVRAEETLLYLPPGFQSKNIQKLKNGHYPIDARLDLHGLTVNEARETLASFVASMLSSQKICALIIHGKGKYQAHTQPILKNQINNWLRQLDEVVAFCSALPSDGGTGAIYLLLHRQ